MKIMRDPLVSAFLIGAVVWIGFQIFGGEPERAPIVISQSFVEGLAEVGRMQLGRAPTDAELESSIREHVEEEVLYREALLLGLDRGDTIVRRRLVQKLKFLLEDAVEAPGRDELERELEAEPERYARPARSSFRQVYFAEELGAAVAAKGRWSTVEDGEGGGVTYLGDRYLVDRTEAELAAIFGPGFAAELEGAELGKWSGPFRSNRGLHLVWIERRTGAAPGTLDDPAVLARANERVVEKKRRERERALIQGLVKEYSVEIEPWRAKVAAAKGARR
jgi:hypothetical protein